MRDKIKMMALASTDSACVLSIGPTGYRGESVVPKND